MQHGSASQEAHYQAIKTPKNLLYSLHSPYVYVCACVRAMPVYSTQLELYTHTHASNKGTQSTYWTSVTGYLDKEPRNIMSNWTHEWLIFYFITIVVYSNVLFYFNLQHFNSSYMTILLYTANILLIGFLNQTDTEL
jgi:hypothetical protein